MVSASHEAPVTQLLARARAGDAQALGEAYSAVYDELKRAAQIVELRYFGGYSEVEIAEMLGISDRTLRRDWRKARAFLLAEMTP